MTQSKKLTTNRKYKSTMFTMIFSDKKELLTLYNAISGKNYTDPELLTINTLENAIYMSMKNDLSFIVDSSISMYEHQSTFNPNMPYRFLIYLSELYSSMINVKKIYGKKKIKIPAPRFVVFYNGQQKQPERRILKLSDLYTVKEEHPALELEVIMLNINEGFNSQLLNSCQMLKEYTEYIYRVRKYTKSMDIEDAVEQAITECIREGILKDFLECNRTEAYAVSIYEFDMEEYIKMEREDAFEDGRTAVLMEKIQKKLKKGKNIEQIADELEEDISVVEDIIAEYELK